MSVRNAPCAALLVAICILAPAYWLALATPAVGIYHDDGIYLTTARSLAAGHGYRIESTPEPMAQTKYPILFPALLSAVWSIAPSFPSNVMWFKLVALLAAAGWIALTIRLLQCFLTHPWHRVALIVLTAAAPGVVFFSTAVMSETVFALLTTAAIYLLAVRQCVVPSAILAAAAFHTRTIGFTLIAAAAVTLWRTSRRDAIRFTSVAGALSLPWIVWQRLNSSSSDPYLSQQNYYAAYNVVFNYDWLEKLRIVLTNVLLVPGSAGPILHAEWAAVLGFLAIPFFWRGLRSAALPPLVRNYLAFTLLVILLWVWPPWRFLIPIAPLVLWAIVEGVPERHRLKLALAFGAIAIWAAFATWSLALTSRQSGIFEPVKATRPDWHNFEAQMRWIEANTPPGAIVQSNFDPTVFLFTSRHAVRGSSGNGSRFLYLADEQPLGNVDQFAATLNRNQVRYVVDTPWNWFLEPRFLSQLIDQLNREHPGALELVHQPPGSKFRIFKYTPVPLKGMP